MNRACALLLLFLAVSVVVLTPGAACACPSCEAAVGAPGSEADDDPLREARAFNSSILFMVAMPYSLLAACAIGLFVLYRQKVRLDEQAQPAGTSLTVAAPP